MGRCSVCDQEPAAARSPRVDRNMLATSFNQSSCRSFSFCAHHQIAACSNDNQKKSPEDLAGDVFAERGKLGLARLPPTRPPFQLFPLLFSTSILRKWMRLAKQGDKLLVNTARVLSPAYLPELDDSTCLKLISPPSHLSFRSLSAFLSHH